MSFRQEFFAAKGYKINIECSKGIYSDSLGISGDRRKMCLRIDYIGPLNDIEISEEHPSDGNTMAKIASPWNGRWNERAFWNTYRDDNNCIWTDYRSGFFIKNDRLQDEKLLVKYIVPSKLAGIGAEVKIYIEDDLAASRVLVSPGQIEEIIDLSDTAPYLVSYLEKSHEIQSILLKEFIRVCTKYGIRYYVFCGTALGAVRSKNFIEWDDDLDVALTRREFDRLMKICENEWGYDRDFCVVTPGSLSRSYFMDYMTRLVYLKEKIHTSVFSRMEGHVDEGLIHKGALDLFILENGADADALHKMQTGLIKGLYGLALGHRPVFDKNDYSGVSGSREVRIASKLAAIGKHIPLPVILKCYDLVRGIFKNSKGKYCFQSNGYINCIDWRFSREWFGDGIEGRIRDIAVSLPADYDKYLKKQYGNYMELPGGFSRRPAHWDTRS